jgi:regulator of protease activity HflC (stomatin/prohibitin superfamily)
MRVKAIDVPGCITKDNISVRAKAVLYFKVSDSAKAILEVENFFYALSQLSQKTMRYVVGEGARCSSFMNFTEYQRHFF